MFPLPFDIFILRIPFKRPASENKRICLWFHIQFHFLQITLIFCQKFQSKMHNFYFCIGCFNFCKGVNLPFKRVYFEMVFSKDFMISLEKDFLQEVLGKKLFDYLFVKHLAFLPPLKKLFFYFELDIGEMSSWWSNLLHDLYIHFSCGGIYLVSVIRLFSICQ